MHQNTPFKPLGEKHIEKKFFFEPPYRPVQSAFFAHLHWPEASNLTFRCLSQAATCPSVYLA